MFSVTYAQLNGWLTAFLWPKVTGTNDTHPATPLVVGPAKRHKPH